MTTKRHYNPKGKKNKYDRQEEACNGISLARFLAHKSKLNDYFEKKLEQEKMAMIDRYFGINSDSNIFGKFLPEQDSKNKVSA